MPVGRLCTALTVLALIAPGAIDARSGTAPPPDRGLCRMDEAVIFTCRARRQIISVCGNSGGMGGQYRIGTPGRIALAFPGSGNPPDAITQRNTAYSGGGEQTIAFARGGFRYEVFSSMIRTNFRAGEPNYPAFSAGVRVFRGERQVSQRLCTDPADAAVDLNAAQAAFPETPPTDP